MHSSFNKTSEQPDDQLINAQAIRSRGTMPNMSTICHFSRMDIFHR